MASAEHEMAQNFLREGIDRGEMIRNHERCTERLVQKKITKADELTHVINKTGYAAFHMNPFGDGNAFIIKFVDYSNSLQGISTSPYIEPGISAYTIEFNRPVYFHGPSGPEQCPLENDKLVKKLFSDYIDYMNGKIEMFEKRLDQKENESDVHTHMIPPGDPEAPGDEGLPESAPPPKVVVDDEVCFVICVVPSIKEAPSCGVGNGRGVGTVSYDGPVVIAVLGGFATEEAAQSYALRASENPYPDIDLYVVNRGWVSPSQLGSQSFSIKTMYTQSRTMQDIHDSFRTSI